MSIVFLFTFLMIALFLALTKYKKACGIVLLFLLVCFIAIGSGWLPAHLLSGIQSSFTHLSAPQWKKNNVIILLGSGTTRLPHSSIYIPSTTAYSRIYKTAELYFSCVKKSNSCKILISGGPINQAYKSDALIYERALIKLGITQNDFILELNSTDTQTNAEFTSNILNKSNFDQVFLVTSGIHMQRSLFWFIHFGVQAKPAPADYLTTHLEIMSLGYNFALTDFIIHEYLGLIEFYLFHFLNSAK